MNPTPVETKQTLFRTLMALLPSRTSMLHYLNVVLFFLFINIADVYAQQFGFISLLFVAEWCLTYLILRLVFDTVSRAINFFYRRNNKKPLSYEDSFTIGIRRLSGAIFWFIFILFIVDVFVPIKTLLGSITIAIALAGLAFRDFVTNFINGVNIMFSRKFQLGEYMQIGDARGRIVDLTFTHVHLITDTQDIIFVPNNLILSKEVVNFSKSKTKNILVRVVVDRSLFEHYRELQSHLEKHMQKHFKEKLAEKDSITIRVDSIEKDVTWLIEYRVVWYSYALETELKNATSEVIVNFIAKKEQEKAEATATAKKK